MCEPYNIPAIQKTPGVYNTNFAPLFLNANPSKTFDKLKKEEENYEGKCAYVQSCFLSESNIQKVQNLLILSVYNKSNKKYRIPFQKKESILIVMKYIYNFYGQSIPHSVKEQIDTLNNLVVAELTPQIINNLNSYYKYLEDSTTQPDPLALPINNSSKGNKILPSWVN